MWGEAVARKYITRVITLQSAPDFDSIKKLVSLRAHPLRGARAGQWALDLTGRYRLIVRPSRDGKSIVIDEVSSHHGD
jgi:hypothetical protein